MRQKQVEYHRERLRTAGSLLYSLDSRATETTSVMEEVAAELKQAHPGLAEHVDRLLSRSRLMPEALTALFLDCTQEPVPDDEDVIEGEFRVVEADARQVSEIEVIVIQSPPPPKKHKRRFFPFGFSFFRR